VHDYSRHNPLINSENNLKVREREQKKNHNLDAKKYLNFSSQESSEADLEDVVMQAPNPSATPKPSRVFKHHDNPPNTSSSKPRFNRITNGYLAPKLQKNEGKKTLVSINHSLKLTQYRC